METEKKKENRVAEEKKKKNETGGTTQVKTSRLTSFLSESGLRLCVFSLFCCYGFYSAELEKEPTSRTELLRTLGEKKTEECLMRFRSKSPCLHSA